MCDYSLMGIPNRLAVEREELVTHRFPSGSIGFASPADLGGRAARPESQDQGFWVALKSSYFSPPRIEPVCAVCIPPGARLFMTDIPAWLQRGLSISSAEEVTFAQVTPRANAYRDAIRFANGREILLQQLTEALLVKVLELSLAEESEPLREESFRF